MCIRDSDEGGEHLGLAGEQALLVGREAVPVPDRGRLRREGCLLYPSDAADERSSGDLGGRRIIKKKTKRQQARQISF